MASLPPASIIHVCQTKWGWSTNDILAHQEEKTGEMMKGHGFRMSVGRQLSRGTPVITTDVWGKQLRRLLPALWSPQKAFEDFTNGPNNQRGR